MAKAKPTRLTQPPKPTTTAAAQRPATLVRYRPLPKFRSVCKSC